MLGLDERCGDDHVTSESTAEPGPVSAGLPGGINPVGLAREALWNNLALMMAITTAVVVTALGFRAAPESLMGVYAIAAGTILLLSVIDPALTVGVSRAVARVRNAQDDDVDRSFIRYTHGLMLVLGAGLALATAVATLVVVTTGLSVPAGAGPMLLLMSLAFAVHLATSAVPAALIGASDYFAGAMASLLASGVTLIVVVTGLPVWGVTALGAAQLMATTSARCYLVRRLRTRVPWFRLRPVRLTRSAAGTIGTSSLPLLLVGASGQIISWAALVIVGAVVGAGAAAVFRVGMLVPTQSIALLYRAYDVIFPRLSAAEERSQTSATTVLTRVFSALAGVLAATLIALRGDLTTFLLGRQSATAEIILVLFALMWACNVPAHGVALLAIARGRQRILTPLVTAEAAANIALTMALVPRYGVGGAAWAALLSLGVFNLVVLPFAMRRHIARAVRIVVGDGLVPLLASAGLSILVLLAVSTTMQGVVRLVAVVSTAVLLALLAAAVSGGSKGRSAMRTGLRKGNA